MVNQTGIAITIKAFLPTGKTLDEMFTALGIVKAAHESGDYSALLKAAGVEDVKTEQKTRRVEEVVQQAAAVETELTGAGALEGAGNVAVVSPSRGHQVEAGSGIKEDFDEVEPKGEIDPVADEIEEAVPEFIKKGKAKAA